MEYPKFKNEFHLPGIQLLPHRDPFLFVDELISDDETGAFGRYTYTDAKTAIPGKTTNTFFEGHFPGYPVVPGVVLVESMAQVAGAALVACKQLPEGDAAFLLAKVEDARFRRPVRPGDTLEITAKLVRSKMNVFVVSGEGRVSGELAVSGEFTFIMA